MNAAQAIQAHIGGTQRATAERVGVSFQQWNRYLRGRASPSADAVLGWCEVLGVTMLVGGDGWEVEPDRCSGCAADVPWGGLCDCEVRR